MPKKWLNNKIYPTRKIGDYPQVYVSRVAFDDKDGLKIALRWSPQETGIAIEMTKEHARMLIRRLEQCLKG